MEFRHGFVNQGIGDFFEVFGSGVDEAGSGDVIDKPGDAAGIVVDDGLSFGIENFIGSIGTAEAMIDVSTGLVFGEGIDPKLNGNTINKIGMGGAFEEEGKGILAAEDNFEGEGGMDTGADE